MEGSYDDFFDLGRRPTNVSDDVDFTNEIPRYDESDTNSHVSVQEEPQDQPLQEELQELPVQTQLYFLDRLLGAALALVSYPIIMAIQTATLLMTFFIAFPIGTSIFGSSLIYKSLRQNHSIIASGLYTLPVALGLIVLPLTIMSVIVSLSLTALATQVALLPFYALYSGFTQGTMKVVDKIRRSLADFAMLSDITMAVLSVHRFLWLALDDTPDYERLRDELRNVDNLLERSYLPKIERLSIKLLLDFISLFTVIATLDENSNIPSETRNKMKLAITFCQTMQVEILAKYYKTASEIPPIEGFQTVQDQIERLLIDQRLYVLELQVILSQSPLDGTALDATYQRIINQTQALPADTHAKVTEIFSSALAKAREAAEIEQNIQNLINSFLNLGTILLTFADDIREALAMPKQQMTEEYFDKTFALSSQSLRSMRHTKLSQTDRDRCKEAAKTNQVVHDLFDRYKKIESDLKEFCPISLDQPKAQNKIVLVKQYCTNNQTTEDKPDDIWLPILDCNSDTIHDRDEFKTYCTRLDPLRREVTHVLSRDSFLSPSPYEKKNSFGEVVATYKTRYRYHDYYQNKEAPNEDAIYSQTLQSLALELSKYVNLPDFNRELRARGADERANQVPRLSQKPGALLLKKAAKKEHENMPPAFEDVCAEAKFS